MKKLLFLSFAAVLLFSCSNKETIYVGYSYGFSSIEASQSDMTIIENFLTDHHCQMSGLLFKGKTLAECDAQAIARFNESVAQFSYNDVVALNLEESTNFIYSCARHTTPSNQNSDIIFIGTFAYPQE
jgi:hypothetical protein